MLLAPCRLPSPGSRQVVPDLADDPAALLVDDVPVDREAGHLAAGERRHRLDDPAPDLLATGEGPVGVLPVRRVLGEQVREPGPLAGGRRSAPPRPGSSGRRTPARSRVTTTVIHARTVEGVALEWEHVLDWTGVQSGVRLAAPEHQRPAGRDRRAAALGRPRGAARGRARGADDPHGRPARGRLAGDGVHLPGLEEPPLRRAVLAVPRRGRPRADRVDADRAAAVGDPPPRRAAGRVARSSRPRSRPRCSAPTPTSSGCGCGSAASSSTGSAPRSARTPTPPCSRRSRWPSPARCCRPGWA